MRSGAARSISQAAALSRDVEVDAMNQRVLDVAMQSLLRWGMMGLVMRGD